MFEDLVKASDALVATGEPALEPLINILNDGDERVINILIKIGNACWYNILNY